ncbi:hypothetical protein RJT34_14110 [Clitoria ternatea]|uniref:Uncharacterized protein n=1 Tax=Clitoria ternatea TaxID=43366 RepID=A0AAN9JSC8_CLITE
MHLEFRYIMLLSMPRLILPLQLSFSYTVLVLPEVLFSHEFSLVLFKYNAQLLSVPSPSNDLMIYNSFGLKNVQTFAQKLWYAMKVDVQNSTTIFIQMMLIAMLEQGFKI